MLRKAQEWESTSIGAPLLGNIEGRSFLRTYLIEKFLWGYREICKMPCKRVSLSIGALLGNLEEFRLPGYLEKLKYIWFPFLDPQDIKIFKSGGHLEP